MKAKLKFNLADESDRREFLIVSKSTQLVDALREFAEMVLRQRRKYDESLSEEGRAVVLQIEDEFYEILGSHGIDLEELA